MNSWLVTGGAGYIGAHVVKELSANGMNPVVVDNFSTGIPSFVDPEIPVIKGDIRDTKLLTNVLIDHDVIGVIHVAGFKYAGVSVEEPLITYANNVEGTASVLQAMDTAGVKHIVFSSSASVYGTPDTELVVEDSPLHPESPYGESKLAGEWLMRDMTRARGFATVCLRYFNVVGSGTPQIFDASPHNLFPIVVNLLRENKTPRINGIDYATPDGTCVRDYIHVQDLALSHVAAAKALTNGRKLLPAYNLGSGDGLSVKQIMDTFARVTGIDFTPDIAPRRPGDPDRIVADGTAAARDLEWKMRYTVDEMVATAWSAEQLRH